MFLLSCNSVVKDADGNEYVEIQIGNQKWLDRNLETTHYQNGDPILYIEDPDEWANTTEGAWCYYNSDSTLGKLYNWYAVEDPRGIAPKGWKVPSKEDWNTLSKHLDPKNSESKNLAGGPLKSTNTLDWKELSPFATDSLGFLAKGSGYRTSSGEYEGYQEYGFWWTSTYVGVGTVYVYNLIYHSDALRRGANHPSSGLSIRCIKEESI